MRFFFSLLFFLLGSVGLTQTSQLDYYKKVIDYLASDELEGRGVGTEKEEQAADFIAEELQAIQKCKVKKQAFSFELDSVRYSSQNVIGFVNRHASKTILISAHYDHIGWGGTLSNSHGIHAVHNGADDNASGVALMLSLAKALVEKKKDVNLLFVAYGAHEVGLFGSHFFSENAKKYSPKLALALNFDMVGRLGAEKNLYYDGTEPILSKFAAQASPDLKCVKSTSDRINTLDSKWLVQQAVPSLTLSTGRQLDYHKVSDDAEYIQFEGIALIEDFLMNWLVNLP